MKPNPRPSEPLDTVPAMLKSQGTVLSVCPDDDKSTKSAPETVVQIGESDPYLVSWDDSDRYENPRNWSKRYRMYLVVIVSLYTLLPPISSTMNAPAIATLMKEFNVLSATVGNMMSNSMIAFVVAPMVYSAISQKLGRKYLFFSSQTFTRHLAKVGRTVFLRLKVLLLASQLCLFYIATDICSARNLPILSVRCS